MPHSASAKIKGTLICAVPILIGVAVQHIIGPFDMASFRFPANVFIGFGFLVLLMAAHFLHRRFPELYYPANKAIAIPAMLLVTIMLLIMACFRQSLSPESTWWHKVLSFWPFIFAYIWMTTILGMETIKNLTNLKTTKLSVTLNHAGLFTVLLFGALGAPDIQNLTIPAVKGTVEWRAQDAYGRLHALPFGIELKAITESSERDSTETAGNITAKISVHSEDSSKKPFHTIAINHPATIRDWTIYLTDYSVDDASTPDFAIFTLVRDPWLPAVYIGILLMASGALITIFSRRDLKLKSRHESLYV